MSQFAVRGRIGPRVLLAVVFCMLVAACGGGDGSSGSERAPLAEPGEEVGAPALVCPADEAEVVGLLRSGLPPSDYDPAVDLADLIGRSSVVVVGEIDSIVRLVENESAHTLITPSNVEVLAGDGVLETFSTASWWAFRDQPDPLGEPVAVDGVRFVAFLEAEREAEGLPEEAFLVRGGQRAEAVLRKLAHLILSLPEAQLG